MNQKLNVLLTGASGFVGNCFLNSYKSMFDIQTISLQQTKIDDLSLSKFDVIVHCAALVHQMKGAPEDQYEKINFLLTQELALKAKTAGVKHFVFLSSAHVYGEYGYISQNPPAFSENSPCNPSDPYGRSKLNAEKVLLSIQNDDFKVSIIRPPMVYGKGAKGNLLALASLIKKIPVLPFGYKNNKRSVIYVENLCYFISLVLKKRASGIFLPQDAEPVSIDFLTRAIGSVVNKKTFLLPVSFNLLKIMNLISPNIVRRLYGSLYFESSTTNQIVDYKPPFTTKEGLAKMFETTN